MTEWIQKQYVVAGIAAVCLVSMLVKCLIRHKYRAMLREVRGYGTFQTQTCKIDGDEIRCLL